MSDQHEVLTDAQLAGKLWDENRCLKERLSLNYWQPIETAPKTSRSRLVWCPGNLCTFLVCWDERRGEWVHFGGDRSLIERPTHWMPLPEPPEADNE